MILLVLLSFVFALPMAFAGEDDDAGIVEYPDGSWGMDIGGGYQAMPSKSGRGYDFEPATPYREDYKDTRYGPMTRGGFVDFPAFKFEAGDEKKKEEELPVEDYIFYESTTTSAGNTLWGVSD
jgi:hypothetical protein